jgi:drug/metabolite transporter (DMT)-like permease
MNKGDAFGESKNPKVIAWGILGILAAVWGSSFILIKYGLLYFSPAQVGSLRIVIAFLFLLPFALKNIRYLKRRDLGWIFLSGMLGNLIPSLLFAYAEQVVPSAVAGVLNSLTPIFTLIIATAFFGGRFTKMNTGGIVVGLAGAVLLMLSVNDGRVDVKIGYALLIVLATLMYAINLNIIKTRFSHIHPVHFTSFVFLLTGPVALIFLAGFTPVVQALSKPEAGMGLLYISVLAIIGTALALMLHNHLIRITNVIFSSSVTYLIPVVATIMGVLDGESLKPQYLIWISIIIGGVFMVNSRKKS